MHHSSSVVIRRYGARGPWMASFEEVTRPLGENDVAFLLVEAHSFFKRRHGLSNAAGLEQDVEKVT